MLQQPLDRFAIARLVEVLADTARDLVADIAHRAQVVLARAPQRLDRVEAQRKLRAPYALADVANSEPVDHAVERGVRERSIASSRFCALFSAIRSSPAT